MNLFCLLVIESRGLSKCTQGAQALNLLTLKVKQNSILGVLPESEWRSQDCRDQAAARIRPCHGRIRYWYSHCRGGCCCRLSPLSLKRSF